MASLLVGLFAGWISVKTTRKLPHDRLKQLVDIKQEIGDLDQDGVIEAAILRELRQLKRLNDARDVGLKQFVGEWIRQHVVQTTLLFSAAIGFIGGLVVVGNFSGELSNADFLASATYFGGFIALALFFLSMGVSSLFRRRRHSQEGHDEG